MTLHLYTYFYWGRTHQLQRMQTYLELRIIEQKTNMNFMFLIGSFALAQLKRNKWNRE